MNSTVFQMSVTPRIGLQPSDHEHLREFDPGIKVILAVLITESIITCVGNALTIIVVCRDSALRTMGNMHITSLASADLIAGLTASFGVVWFINEHVGTFLSTNKFCCLLWYILFFVSFAASLFSMTLIAMDRWIFITYPLRYYIWITPLKTTFFIGSAWIAAMLFGLLSIAFNTFDTVAVCCTQAATSQAYLTYGIGIILFGSCAISFVFYFKIFLIAKKQKCSIAQSAIGDRVKYRSSYKQIKIMFLICCISLFCWIPFYIENLPHVPAISYEASNLTMCLALLNSCANFFLYSAKNAAFRKSFLKLLPRFQHRVDGT
ncbi:beta-2 adrenergic receptor-like [Gigantopelta aegis]|uniref:beta-2 adrenergic receptor-like n=1 Tax=Gigantopelta aegis TaxID=1735272 RepID=UPI001B88CDB5|nr:beta-2 adrenergic receptor-like [Gigantopelta aegis]